MAKYAVGRGLEGNVEKIHISTSMSGKMEGIEALSTSCLCNHLCMARKNLKGSICESCFACATVSRYKALGKCLESNYRVLTSRLLSESEAACVRFNSTLGRIEAFGDVANAVHPRNYLRIIKSNPQTNFGVWSKNPGYWDEAIQAEGKPSNVTMVLSSLFKNMPCKDYKAYSWVDYVFTVYTPDWLESNGKDEDFINCGARDCTTCQRCYKHHDGSEPIMVNELLK